MNKKLKGLLAIIFIALLVGGAIAFVDVHRHVLTVTGPSMAPTLANGQTIVWKPYAANQSPKVNDIVLFHQAGLQKYGVVSSSRLIKRIVGAPGDRVEIKNNKLTVYNAKHPKGYNPDSALNERDIVSGNITVSLSAGQYFVLGDKPSNSLDSRQFGSISRNSIIGYVNLDSGLAKALNSQK